MKKKNVHCRAGLHIGLLIACTTFFLAPVSHGAFDFSKIFGGLSVDWGQENRAKEQEAKAEQEALEREIQAFAQTKNSRPPAEAASGWLALFDQMYPAKAASSDYYYFQRDSFESLAEAVPHPDAWPELARLVGARPAQTGVPALRESLLKMFICRLTGDYAALRDQLEQLNGDLDKLPRHQRSELKEQLDDMVVELLPRISRFQGLEAEGFEELVDRLGGRKVLDDRWKNDLSIPDLVGLAGEQQAEALLLKALALPAVELEVPSGGQTLELAKRLAAEHIASLGAAQWKLVASPDDAGLFEKMWERFPVVFEQANPSFPQSYSPNPLRYDRQDAMKFYLVGLIARKEVDKAVGFVVSLDPRALSKFRLLDSLVGEVPAGSLAGLTAFYEGVLIQCPTAPARKGLFLCTLLAGKTEEAVAGLRQKLAEPDLEPEHRIAVQVQLANIYLAMDELDAGLVIYTELLEASTEGLSSEALDQLVNIGEASIDLGVLLEKDRLIKSGMERMTSAGLAQEKDSEDELMQLFGWRNDLVNKLIELHRFKKAEASCNDMLAAALKQQQKESASTRFSYSSRNGQSRELARLMLVYNETGGFEKSIELLETSTLWGKEDLAGLVGSSWGNNSELLLYVAKALHETGRSSEALPILEVHLFRSPDDDPAYQLLLAIKGEDALPMLDEIYSRDRFEERPLIWKAQLLKNLNRLEEAEVVARLALSVDPTDGEQRAGDRVRAYAVLSDILAARGNAKDAAFFADVVESVRVAEKGDAFHQVGLVTRGLQEYEKAEVLFADAYCVQWRLAERLYAMGRIEEAMAHYEIAFKRLPEQFGQVASFCFGCEGVFSSGHTRSIAERILLDLEKTTPDRPQLHYLLGQLRSEQGMASAAYVHLRKAVELDPDYLDAWEMLNDLSAQVSIPQSERDAVQLKMLSLDPLQRHARVEIAEIADLEALWRALEAGGLHRIQTPESLMPLPATAAYLEGQRAKQSYSYTFDDSRLKMDSPEQMIAGDEMAEAIGDMLGDTLNP